LDDYDEETMGDQNTIHNCKLIPDDLSHIFPFYSKKHLF